MISIQYWFTHLSIFLHRTLSIDCDEAQQTIVAQMNEWENNPCPEPVDGKPNGQKCKYKVKNVIDKYNSEAFSIWL